MLIHFFYVLCVDILSGIVSEKPEYFVLYSLQQPDDRRYFVGAGKSPELTRTGVTMNMILQESNEAKAVTGAVSIDAARQETVNKVLR
jgi:hypothetical protein